MKTASRQSLTLRWLLLSSVGIMAAAWPTRSSAFSDPNQFATPALSGGGGGRYFTASPVDGYGCGVCHRGGAEPKVRVNGLPVNGFQPGVPYDIELTWENPAAASHALQLELLGRDGRVPGQVVLPDQATVAASGRCRGLAAGKVPTSERIVGSRKILVMEACFAQSFRFRFTPANVADLAFSVSFVASNNLASVEGDGVFTLRRVLRRVGEPARTGDCSIEPGRRTPFFASAFLLLLGAIVLRRRFRAR
jgi:hypothetical protein